MVKDLDGRCPTWGYAGAPLFTNEKIVVQTGSPHGSLVALDAQTGKKIWRGGRVEAGYASPYVRKANQNEVVVFNQAGLSIHDLGTGQEKISYQHRTRYEVNAAQPLDLGHKILVASGYGKGAVLLDLEGPNRVFFGSQKGLHARWQALCTGKVGLRNLARRGPMPTPLFLPGATEGRKPGRSGDMEWGQ